MENLNSVFNKWNINLDDIQVEQFCKYYELLIQWNEKMNLTSIIDKDEVIHKHFLDSSALIKYCDLSNLRLLDVGTGAGFPGIVLKILVPNCKITLLDSLAKRIGFLNAVISELDLKDVETIHGRAEDFARDNVYREKYDLCVSRAVANLSTLSELCLPFVKVGGYFISYKSDKSNEEIENAKHAYDLLGGKLIDVFTFNINDNGRSLVIINKIKNTNKKFPRKAGVPGKEPL